MVARTNPLSIGMRRLIKKLLAYAATRDIPVECNGSRCEQALDIHSTDCAVECRKAGRSEPSIANSKSAFRSQAPSGFNPMVARDLATQHTRDGRLGNSDWAEEASRQLVLASQLIEDIQAEVRAMSHNVRLDNRLDGVSWIRIALQEIIEGIFNGIMRQ